MDDKTPRTAVVTGANSGIGYETTKGLVDRGLRVVMGCRSLERGESARARLEADRPHAQLSVEELDLADADSIQAFAKRLHQEGDPVEVLVNNAGLWNQVRRENNEGLELTFAVNHLGTFRLTQALLPLLQRSPAARIVNVASTAHHFARPDWDDLQMGQRYDGNRQYCNTKLYNIWTTKVLAERLQGTSVTANAVHPGSGITNLTRDFPDFVGPLFKPFLKSPQRLAQTSIRVATDPALAGRQGEYFHLGRHGHQSPRAKDMEQARRLWQVTEGLA